MRDLVHHLAALLPRDGGALLPRHRLALLLVNITCLHHGLVLAHLAGNLATVFTRLLDIITNLQTNQGLENQLNKGSIYLLRDLVADHVVGDGALAVGDEAGFGPGHEGAEWRGTAVWAPGHTGGWSRAHAPPWSPPLPRTAGCRQSRTPGAEPGRNSLCQQAHTVTVTLLVEQVMTPLVTTDGDVLGTLRHSFLYTVVHCWRGTF